MGLFVRTHAAAAVFDLCVAPSVAEGAEAAWMAVLLRYVALKIIRHRWKMTLLFA